MKTRSVVLSLVLLIIFGGIFEYNFKIEKVEKNKNTNIVTAIERFDVKANKSKTTKKTKTSVKKATKKKATKKATKKTTKKTTKKATKKKTTRKKKTTKRTSNQQISELQAYAKDLVINK